VEPRGGRGGKRRSPAGCAARQAQADAEAQRAATAAALADAQANLIWSRLEFRGFNRLQPDEVDALWDLAIAEPATRDAFLEQMSENPRLVLRFAQEPEPVFRAFGLRLGAEQARAALGPVLGAMGRTTDPVELRALAKAVGALPVQLTAEQGQGALDTVLGAMRGATDPDALEALAGAVRALAPQLGAEEARVALGAVLEAMRGNADPYALETLAGAAEALAPGLAATMKADMLRLAYSGLGSAGSGADATAWARMFETLLPPPPADGYIGALVAVLKYPTAALRDRAADDGGPASATEYLIGKLRERFPGARELQDGSLEDVVAWIAANYPEVGHDLARPLVRPAPLVEVAAKAAASLPLPH
jgi:hypothetical protein